jgi:hypothetical protein
MGEAFLFFFQSGEAVGYGGDINADIMIAGWEEFRISEVKPACESTGMETRSHILVALVHC